MFLTLSLAALVGAADPSAAKRIAYEIAARLAQYQADKVGLTFVMGQVTLDGRPLGGATVTLVPENFMGPAVKAAKGTTGADGACSFQTDGAEVGGVQCGVFRIELSKKDAGGKETLPARYNANTTLGVEVWMGIRDVTLNLKSR